MSMGKRNPFTFIVGYFKKYGSYNKKYDTLLRGIIDNADKVDNIDLPNKTNVVLTDHDKALHDALDIDADTVDGIDLPNTIANVLTDHNKAVHDALRIDADTVDGHDAGTAAGNVLVLDTAGQVPLANLPLLPASQLGFSFAWELVGSISETGVSSIEFTGLAGDTDKLYMLVLAVENPNTGATDGIFARYNADTTIGHYDNIIWRNAAGTTSTSYQKYGSTSGVAGVPVGYLPNTAHGMFYGIIHAEGISDGTNTYVYGVFNGFNENPEAYNNIAGGWIKQAEIDTITIFTKSGVTLRWKAYLFKPKW